MIQSPLTIRKCLLALCAALLVASASAVAQQSQIEKAATEGRNTILGLDRKPTVRDLEARPDLLFLKDGKLVEAWQLKLDGTRLDFVHRDERGEPARATVAKHLLHSVRFGFSLADYLKDQEVEKPAAPPTIAAAERQPVRQMEILAGKFVADQGRFTRWTCTFTSELNKFYPYARNATEYGTFSMRSHMVQPVSESLVHENEVIAKGRYFLYAPGVLGNDDWVLNLTEASYTENDIAPRQSVYTERLRDEVFILKLSKDTNVFNLEWANQEGWQWTAPTQQTFYRTGVVQRANPPRRGEARPVAEDIARDGGGPGSPTKESPPKGPAQK